MGQAALFIQEEWKAFASMKGNYVLNSNGHRLLLNKTSMNQAAGQEVIKLKSLLCNVTLKP